jgi:Ion channel
MTGWVRSARRHPSALLLVAQLLGVLIYPFMGESPTGRAAISLFSLLVLALALWAVRATPALTQVSLVLGVPAVIGSILEALVPRDQTILLVSSIIHAAFYFYTTYALIRYMFSDERVTRDELYATGATFTVVAWAFAYLYVACQIVWPGSFIAAVDPESPRTWLELLFVSFTTLTSVGLGDVIPVQPQARALVMTEMVAGVMYLALVVSRLVGLTFARRR